MTRRKPAASELAGLIPIAETLEKLLGLQAEQPDDKAFALSLDRKVLEPVREVVRAAAAVWTEPCLGMLCLILTKSNKPVEQLYNGKCTRAKALEELAQVAVDLRKLAEMG